MKSSYRQDVGTMLRRYAPRERAKAGLILAAVGEMTSAPSAIPRMAQADRIAEFKVVAELMPDDPVVRFGLAGAYLEVFLCRLEKAAG